MPRKGPRGWLEAGMAGVGNAIALFSKVSNALHAQVERYASDAAGVPVRLRKVSVSPLAGTGRAEGLTIANPDGFDGPEALRVEDLRIALKPRSLLSGSLAVTEVVVDTPVLTWQLGADGGNLGRLRKNVEKALRREAGANGTPHHQRKIVVERLVVRNGRLRLSAAALGGPMTLVLPDLELRGLGRRPGGSTVREVTAQVIDELLRSAFEAAGGAGKALTAARAAASKALKGLLGRR